jgi:hypothetical protein
LLIRKRQALKVFRKKKGASFNDENLCLGVVTERFFYKSKGTASTTDNDIVKLLFLSNALPFSIGNKKT